MRFIRHSRGLSLVEVLVVTAVVIAIAIAGMSTLGSSVKKEGSNAGNDIKSFNVTVPVVNKDTTGAVTINNTGTTGIPTSIILQ